MNKLVVALTLALLTLQGCAHKRSISSVTYELEIIDLSSLKCELEDHVIYHISDYTISRSPIPNKRFKLTEQNTAVLLRGNLHYEGERNVYLFGCKNSYRYEAYRITKFPPTWSEWRTPDYINVETSPLKAELGGYTPHEDDYSQKFNTRIRFYAEPWVSPLPKDWLKK